MKQTGVIAWSSSAGIAGNDQLRLFFPGVDIQRIKPWSSIGVSSCESADVCSFVVGWGNKSNTKKAIAFAESCKLPYVRLEDGFIGYLGHPSADNERLSLIKDDVGIYYDARSPSKLEALCLAVKRADVDLDRARSLVDAITSAGISKYNSVRSPLPVWLNALVDDDLECVLLVDQTAGDQSIVSGLASADTFMVMLQAALSAHPGQPIIIKTHPDVLISGGGGKCGHFTREMLRGVLTEESFNRVHLLTDDCSIQTLMSVVGDVYVVTSQLGFEALMYGKAVHCFGMPFYGGWGLTDDYCECTRRNVVLSLPELVFASLIQYPTYVHPESRSLCEVEEVVAWLALQLEADGIDVCYAFGFSLWKRAFVKQFVGRLAASVVFVNDEEKLVRILSKNNSTSRCSVLLWGRGRRVWADDLCQYAAVWFMEDGFLRSVGLGADLRRPSCLVIDRQGMYYDSSDASDIISILNATRLSVSQNNRAEALIAQIKQQAVTKYNVGVREDSETLLADLTKQANGREIIVVTGQFENDLSIACSLGEIKTNIGLLEQVRADHSSAFIIFKEHPDVYSGVRPGALGEIAAAKFADLYLADIDMDSLLACCDRICTLTSLAGFEALLRNKAVTVYGSPFYAGWGLTTDQLALPNRENTLSLNELVYGAMIEYSRYVDWNTGHLTGPEQTVAFLADERALSGAEPLNSGWAARQIRKLHYLFDMYFR